VKLLLLVAVSFAVARLVLPQALQLLVRYASTESGRVCAAWLARLSWCKVKHGNRAQFAKQSSNCQGYLTLQIKVCAWMYNE
jgi:hypothetical protein